MLLAYGLHTVGSWYEAGARINNLNTDNLALSASLTSPYRRRRHETPEEFGSGGGVRRRVGGVETGEWSCSRRSRGEELRWKSNSKSKKGRRRVTMETEESNGVEWSRGELLVSNSTKSLHEPLCCIVSNMYTVFAVVAL